ncbi:MAG: DHH family phosphoesterase, partial [Acidimicrobiia bacterium]
MSHQGVTHEGALKQAAALIADAPVVALACHVSPDGDALGSMLALHHSLQLAGRTSVASFPSPFVVAPHYRELPGLETLVPPGEFPSEPDVMVTFDCGSMARLGDLEPAATAARELIVLDHHVSNDRYGSVNVIDPAAAATGVVVRRLMEELGLAMAHDAAVCLYAALICDTGRFQYESTNASVFALAGELVAFDVPVSTLSRSLFEEHRFAYLQLVAEVLGRAELCVDERFVWTAVTVDDLE